MPSHGFASLGTWRGGQHSPLMAHMVWLTDDEAPLQVRCNGWGDP
jgi:hypothetical protein